MNSALDVARYIINYGNEKDYSISNLKLQKLLYFVQAYYLAFSETKSACFPEEIEAWDFGPVVPVVYHEFKHYGSSDIPPIKSYLEFANDNIWSFERVLFTNDIIPKGDQDIISRVVDKFSPYSATALVKLTHNQKPWKDAYVPSQNNTITKDSIREYFAQNE